MSGFEQCPSCTWRISRDEEDWQDALHEHREAHADNLLDGPPCKVDGCHEPAQDTRGRYAKLCEHHKTGARAAATKTVKPPPGEEGSDALDAA